MSRASLAKTVALPFPLLLALGLGIACKRQTDTEAPFASSQTPDRLESGEPMIGTPRVFSLDVPDGLRIVAQYHKNVHLSGSLSLASAVEAIQRQLEPALMEFTPKRALWERALVKGEPSQRVLRIEVTREGTMTRVQISDVTGPPPIEGLSDAERWQQAGRNPDGSLKDPSQML